MLDFYYSTKLLPGSVLHAVFRQPNPTTYAEDPIGEVVRDANIKAHLIWKLMIAFSLLISW